MIRNRILIVLLLIGSGILGGCGLFGGESLEPAAKKYYDYRVGQGSHRFSSFISPAYKGQISSEDLALLDSKFNPGQPNTRFQPIKLTDVAVSVDGIYGVSRANPKLGATYSKMETVRWVRDGKLWYLYLNSEAEVSAYGQFPDSLPPPQFIEQPADAEK